MPPKKRSKKRTKEPEINVGGDLKLPLSEVERRIQALTGEGEFKWNVRVIA